MNTIHCTGIVILNYNNWEDTINCIKSVEKFNTAKVKYIIVDNGSPKEGVVQAIDDFLVDSFGPDYDKYIEGQAIQSPLKKVSFLISGTNDGYAQGNNKGLALAYADSEIDEILILNNDILFVQDIIEPLRVQLYDSANCAIVSPLLFKKNLEGIDYNCARREHNPWEIIIAYMCMYKDLFGLLKYYDGKQYFLKGHDELLKNKSIGIDLPSGSCMLMKKNVLRNIGGFDPNTFLFYEEDILYKKLSKLKLNSYLVPECKCIHLGACSTSKTTNYFSLSAQFKSSLYYLHNYVDLSVIQRVCLLLGSMVFRVNLWAIKMQKS